MGQWVFSPIAFLRVSEPSDFHVASERQARLADLARLPEPVAAAAHVYDNGEVSWPNHHAEAAVNALADAGFLILGLDARTHFPDGRLMDAALEDLAIATEHGDHVLITDSPPDGPDNKIG